MNTSSLLAHGELAPAGTDVGETPLARPDSTPLCKECGARPCKRSWGYKGRQSSKEFGPPRMVDGKAYRWFCSNTCSGKFRGASADMRARVLASSLVNVRNAERRTLERLVAACKDVMDEQGKVDAKDMVRAMMREIRKERTNTATRKWQRKTGRREAA